MSALSLSLFFVFYSGFHDYIFISVTMLDQSFYDLNPVNCSFGSNDRKTYVFRSNNGNCNSISFK